MSAQLELNELNNSSRGLGSAALEGLGADIDFEAKLEHQRKSIKPADSSQVTDYPRRPS
jgi:hypothetical protein